MAEAESPQGVVELERGDPEVEGHPVDRGDAVAPKMLGEIGEVAVHEGQGGLGTGESPARAVERRGIAVDGDDAATGAYALEERGGDAACTECAVDEQLPRSGLQALYEGV